MREIDIYTTANTTQSTQGLRWVISNAMVAQPHRADAQVRRERTDQPLPEASIFWSIHTHTKVLRMLPIGKARKSQMLSLGEMQVDSNVRARLECSAIVKS
jgi:hypothetical protein